MPNPYLPPDKQNIDDIDINDEEDTLPEDDEDAYKDN